MLHYSTAAALATLLKRAAVSGEHAPLYKRAFGGAEPDAPVYELPGWAPLVIFINVAVFFPILLILSYTFQNVFPALAMVEDENPPPAYQPVPLMDGSEENAHSSVPGSANTKAPTIMNVDGSCRPVTSSFRAINRLLRSHGGFAAYFRGFFCLSAHNLATGLLQIILAGVFPGPLAAVGALVASLALVQLSTAWVHIIISTPSKLHFWRRLPPFRRTFDATARPVALFWLAIQITNLAPLLLAKVIGLQLPEIDRVPGEPTTVPVYEASDAWKTAIIAAVAIVSSLFLVVPAHVILVRVQASLLPEDEDTIVAFDRSFGGAVTPAIVDGKGYATIAQAWHTFRPSAWLRLIVLYVKTFIVNVAAMLAMGLVVAPQVYVVLQHSTIKDPKNGGR